MLAMCHVWTAPSWQGFSSRLRADRCSHVFGLLARHTGADGHNALRGSGPGQNLAFDNALAHVGCPDRRIDRLLYDAAVTPCAQQLGALAGIIDKAAAHCATNKIEESALLQDRLYPAMFCLARQIRQSADFAMNTGGRLAGVAPPAMPAVDDTSFAAAKSRVETALA